MDEQTTPSGRGSDDPGHRGPDAMRAGTLIFGVLAAAGIGTAAYGLTTGAMAPSDPDPVAAGPSHSATPSDTPSPQSEEPSVTQSASPSETESGSAEPGPTSDEKEPGTGEQSSSSAPPRSGGEAATQSQSSAHPPAAPHGAAGDQPLLSPEPNLSVDQYRVQSGQTLSEVARETGLSVGRIMQANGLGDPDLIVADTDLKLPERQGSLDEPGEYHVVQRGDTLWDLSRRYGTTVQALVEANAIQDPDVIYVGEFLDIPQS